MSANPRVTIGVTTYDRLALLAECLHSIAEQTEEAFEVIIGNDNPNRVLRASDVALDDTRFRFVNHQTNRGELPNMNFLLGEARGKYFTWLADDDVYEPHYLAEMLAAIERHQTEAVFCGYRQGESFVPDTETQVSTTVLEGSDFLGAYLSGEIRTLGVYGLFDRGYLLSLGGMRQLGSGFSPYSDNLLTIEAGQLARVAFTEAPLVFFRAHTESVSYTSTDLSAYLTAQEDLADRCSEVFPLPQDDAFKILLLRWFIRDFVGLVLRCRGVTLEDFRVFLALQVKCSRGVGLTRRTGLFLYLLRKTLASLRQALTRSR